MTKEAKISTRVLIIEDSPDYLDVLTYALNASGYTLLIARNGQEGLEKARKERPDIILPDLMLPSLNGYEICAMLKQDVRFQKIPILILSATKVQNKDEQLAIECGADAYLLKSIPREELISKIQELLGALRKSEAKTS